MKAMVTVQKFVFIWGFILLLCIHEYWCSPPFHFNDSPLMEGRTDASVPEISPSAAPQGPQPLIPLLAPSPLAPFTNSTIPKLSGLCMFNFSAVEHLMSVTSIDCYSSFAFPMANVICCPQLEATLVILIGQYSKVSKQLALNGTLAKHCLSDTEQILMGQGASNSLRSICSVDPSDLTEASCPVKDVDEFERTADTSELLAACEKIDLVKECCHQICQNAIREAATRISLKSSIPLSTIGQKLSGHSTKVNDCKRIVLRWLASKLDMSRAKEVLRGLSSCNTNKVCPLVFPDTRHVAENCTGDLSNRPACCNAMNNYVSHLQKQFLITNFQALDCSAKLGMKLKKSNVTENIYGLCRISLKDFSLQVGNQESGCLLPSLPSDATLDKSTGVSFLCDLNDNIPAPWPSAYQSTASSCNKSVNIPALPAATSDQCGIYGNRILSLHLVCLLLLMTIF